MDTTLATALSTFIRQRPGFRPGNYMTSGADAAGRRALRRDMLTAQRDRRAALAMLAYCEGAGIPVNLPAGGRLTWNGARLDYCAGQYWCTEYRAAVCRALADAIRTFWRDSFGWPGDTIRRAARAPFGAYAARRYFA